jgi:purine-nucleoside phosphorylase
MEETMTIVDQLNEAVDFIRQHDAEAPEVGIVLGSGLGEFADTIEQTANIPYGDIPYFKKVKVKGHAGRLVMGSVGGRKVAVMQGRYHYYEGHHIHELVFPVRVLCKLGAKKILLTNAAGGINKNLEPGDLMIIKDHINLMGTNPLKGENEDDLGPRFPDMSTVYDMDMRQEIAAGMIELDMNVNNGVYAAMMGPSYETPAEIKMLSVMGADAVGMSTVPEAIAARHMGAKVAGISCVTNLAAGISENPLSHDEVKETAGLAAKGFIKLLNIVIPKL